MEIVSKIISLFEVGVAHGQGAGGGGDSGVGINFNLKNLNPWGACDKLDCLLKIILDKLIVIAIPIFTIMLVWGGVRMITAGGSPEKFKDGQTIIKNAVIGFIVILLADSVALVIQSLLK